MDVIANYAINKAAGRSGGLAWALYHSCRKANSERLLVAW